MNKLLKYANKVCNNIKKYVFYTNSIIYTDRYNKKHVIKNNTNNYLELYNYLKSRGFNYIPNLEYIDDDIYIYSFEENIISPKEQRLSDIIKLDSYLHNKTSYFKDVSLDEIKQVYEYLKNKIIDVNNYYETLIENIESNVYMSPSQYLLARNYSFIYYCLDYSSKELDSWYELVTKNRKIRFSVINNNLDIEHIIKNENNYLINWDKALNEMPIYDFIYLYKKYFNSYDFSVLFKEYIKRFSLNIDEEKLLFINLFIPYKIYFSSNEIDNTVKVANLCKYLTSTDNLFMENQKEYANKQNHKINKEQKDLKPSA